MDIPKQLMIGSVPYDVEVVKGWLEERKRRSKNCRSNVSRTTNQDFGQCSEA